MGQEKVTAPWELSRAWSAHLMHTCYGRGGGGEPGGEARTGRGKASSGPGGRADGGAPTAVPRGEAARGEEAGVFPSAFRPPPFLSVSPGSLGSWRLTKMAGAGARAGLCSAAGTF